MKNSSQGNQGEDLQQLAAQALAGHPAAEDQIIEATTFLATDRSSCNPRGKARRQRRAALLFEMYGGE